MLRFQDIDLGDRANRQSFFDNMKGGTFDTPSVDSTKILNASAINTLTTNDFTEYTATIIEDSGLDATIDDIDAFRTHTLNFSDKNVFVYDSGVSSWIWQKYNNQVSLTDFGISYIVNPSNGDKIVVVGKYNPNLTDCQNMYFDFAYQKDNPFTVSYREIADVPNLQEGDIYFKIRLSALAPFSFVVNVFGTNTSFSFPTNTTWQTFISSIYNEIYKGKLKFTIDKQGYVRIYDSGVYIRIYYNNTPITANEAVVADRIYTTTITP